MEPSTKEETAQQSLEDDFDLPQIPQEEIDKNTLTEDLTECQRIKILLTKKDQPSSQSYVFHNAVNIFKENKENIQQQLIPVILKDMGSYSEQLQTEAAIAFTELVNQHILEQVHYKDLKQVCIVMLKQWSRNVLQSWINVYVVLIEVMTGNPESAVRLRGECVDCVLKMSDHQHPISVRQSSALFLGKISQRNILVPGVYVEQLWQRVLQLSGDEHWEVRSMMCKQLSHISQFIGLEKTNELIVPLILLLIGDKDTTVQRKAFQQYIKLMTLKLISSEIINSGESKEQIKFILKTTLAHNCSVQTRLSILKKLTKLIPILDPKVYSDDSQLEELLIEFLKIVKRIEQCKTRVSAMLGSLPHLYQHNGKLAHSFYPKVIKDFLLAEVSSQGITKEIKKSIAAEINTLLISCLRISNEIQFHESGYLASVDLIFKYGQLLQIGNKEITNEIVIRAISLLQFLLQNQKLINKDLLGLIQEKINHPLFHTVEQVLQSNWRFHLNYFEHFLSKYLLLAGKDEATLIVFPLLLKGLREPSSSIPLKRFIAHFWGDVLHNQVNMYLRLSIEDAMLQQFAKSISCQHRQIFVFFLENLILQISRKYFQSMFMEAYFNLSADPVISILMGFVKLAPLVREKIDDPKQVQNLNKHINSIQSRFSDGCHKSQDLLALTEQVQHVLIDPSYLQKVHQYQSTQEHEIEVSEHHLRDLENADKVDSQPKKKKEMELFIKKMREEGVKTNLKVTIKPLLSPLIKNYQGMSPLIKYTAKEETKKSGTPTHIRKKSNESVKSEEKGTSKIPIVSKTSKFATKK